MLEKNILSPQRHEFPPPRAHTPLLLHERGGEGRGSKEESRVDINCSFYVLHSTETSPKSYGIIQKTQIR
jgi:hypothetical protein